MKSVNNELLIPQRPAACLQNPAISKDSQIPRTSRETLGNNQDDFSHWLTNHNSSETPLNKQISGDEYYWQHQTQLQQSDLRFEARPIEPKPLKQMTAETPEKIVNAPLTVQALKVQLHYQATHSPLKHSLPFCTDEEKFKQIFIELTQTLEQIMPSSTTGNNRITVDSNNKLKSIDTAQEWLNSNPAKISHLFIQGEQAELTLNLHQFNKQEQKELIHMLQEHLKKKGLRLSRLIINGVNND